MCKRLGLAGCLETSSRIDNVMNLTWNAKTGVKRPRNLQPTSYFGDLDDAFFMAACNCIDQTTA